MHFTTPSYQIFIVNGVLYAELTTKQTMAQLLRWYRGKASNSSLIIYFIYSVTIHRFYLKCYINNWLVLQDNVPFTRASSWGHKTKKFYAFNRPPKATCTIYGTDIWGLFVSNNIKSSRLIKRAIESMGKELPRQRRGLNYYFYSCFTRFQAGWEIIITSEEN